jgi:hypothetical protein
MESAQNKSNGNVKDERGKKQLAKPCLYIFIGSAVPSFTITSKNENCNYKKTLLILCQ